MTARWTPGFDHAPYSDARFIEGERAQHPRKRGWQVARLAWWLAAFAVLALWAWLGYEAMLNLGRMMP